MEPADYPPTDQFDHGCEPDALTTVKRVARSDAIEEYVTGEIVGVRIGNRRNSRRSSDRMPDSYLRFQRPAIRKFLVIEQFRLDTGVVGAQAFPVIAV